MYAQPTLNGSPFVPTSYANITTFGQTSVQIIPIPATYQSGYLAGQGFPAENENYLMYNLTNSVNALANDLANIHAEILNVLSGQSIPPDNSNTQLNTAIGNKITNTVTGTYINNALTGAGINTALVAYGGNVGIGKSPSSTLDVNGNINGNTVSIAGVSVGTSLTTLQTNINGKNPLATSSSGIGQFFRIFGISTNAGGTGSMSLPSGGTWIWSYTLYTDSNDGNGIVSAQSVKAGGPTAGGTVLEGSLTNPPKAVIASGWAWRVS